MKDILVLLVLLNVQTFKVCCSQPYEADSDGKCRNETTEYPLEGTNLCCKKCRAGERVRQECSKTTETVCEPCPAGQFREQWNYSPTCQACETCKSSKNLLELQNCSRTTRSRCGCKPGTFCEIGFDDPYCESCRKYFICKVGFGVSVPGKANSNVRCERCPDGTFSDTASHTDRCRPHTICLGRVVKKGNATSDTVCEPEAFISNTQLQTSTKEPHSENVFTTASTMVTMVSAPSDATLSTSLSVSTAVFNHSTKSPQPSPLSDSKLAAAIAIPIVIGVIIFFIFFILLCCRKKIWKKAAGFHPKVDANGNCETGDKDNQGYLGENQLISFKVTASEQQCLLEKGEACSDQSQSSNTSETLTRTDGCSSCESIGPLQSTLPLDNPHSALSEPRTLQSNTEPVTPQTSVPTQRSSPPTSPQIISPVTPSPQVNVNIILNIGNGSGGTPSVMPTDLMQVDPKLRFGEEEESFSIPQQEDGKQTLMSVQESESYSALGDTCKKD
ncbi:tumor necrosis factor receptor superfamily member 1B isoform 2-T2 [Symphorus nematophorus]